MKIFIQCIGFLYLCAANINIVSAISIAPRKLEYPLVSTSAPFALVMEYHTGEVLFNHHGQTPMVPSSMTKLVTSFVLFDAVRKGQFSWDSPIFVSQNAAKKEGSRMMLIPNQQVSLKDINLGIIVCSGNDACTAFAEAYSGTEESFAQHMNTVAQKLGATNSNFMNASGLPHPQHKSTCLDLALITRQIIKQFPEYYLYFRLKEFTFNKIRQWSHNLMVRRGFADGVKTGKTDAGGYGMVASAERNGQRFIVVLNGTKSESERFQQSKTLLDWAFSQFVSVTIVKNGTVFKEIPVLGTEHVVGAYSPVFIGACIPRQQLKDAKVKIVHYNTVRAPVRKGQVLGEINIVFSDKSKKTFGLYADRDIVISPWWRRALYTLRF